MTSLFQPSPATSTLKCAKCGASNNSYAKFCASCGGLVEPPQRPEVVSAGLRLTNTVEVSVNKHRLYCSFWCHHTVCLLLKNGEPQWLPVGLSTPIPKYDVSTQTVGIVYPSEKSLSQQREKDEQQKALMTYMSDKKPVMTAVSPGKGQ